MAQGEASTSSDIGDDHDQQRFAAASQLLADAPDPPSATVSGGGRKRKAAAAEGNHEQQVSSGEQQKVADATAGAIAPRPSLWSRAPQRHLHDSLCDRDGSLACCRC